MNANRDKGHRYEREVAQWFRELGFGCTTSRYSSKALDDAGVDMCNVDPFTVQCKFVKNLGSHHKVLSEMPEESGKYKALFHKKAREGTVVSMPLEHFRELLEMLIGNGIISPKQ